jgi:hypothetical protein
LRFGAGEVVEEGAPILVAVERLDQHLLGLLVPAAVEHGEDVGVRLPRTRTVRLARPPADRQDGRARVERHRAPGRLGIAHEDDRARRRVHLLASDAEPRAARDDDVQLFVSGRLLVMLGDDRRARLVRRPCVDAEGLHAQAKPDRRTSRPPARDRRFALPRSPS